MDSEKFQKSLLKCRIFNYLFCIQGSRYYSNFKPRLLVFVCPGFNAQIAYMWELRGRSMGRVKGVRTSPPEMTCSFLIQLAFCKKKTMWFIGVEVEQETSAPPPKKNPGSAPGATVRQKVGLWINFSLLCQCLLVMLMLILVSELKDQG